jgi:DNA gyrase subunit B
MTQDPTPAKHAYDASSITVLEGLSAVRKRGLVHSATPTVRGLHTCLRGVENTVDEALRYAPRSP